MLFDINEAVLSLKEAFDKKLLVNTFENEEFFNIKKMQKLSYLNFFHEKKFYHWIFW